MAINYEGIKYQDFVEHGITKTVDQLTEDDYVRTNKGAQLPLQALKVEKQISGVATSDDLTSDNSMLMQVGGKLKKIDAGLLAGAGVNLIRLEDSFGEKIVINGSKYIQAEDLLNYEKFGYKNFENLSSHTTSIDVYYITRRPENGIVDSIMYKVAEPGVFKVYKVLAENPGNKGETTTLIKIFTNTADDVGQIKVEKLGVELGTNEYIGIAGNIVFGVASGETMYLAGGNSTPNYGLGYAIVGNVEAKFNQIERNVESVEDEVAGMTSATEVAYVNYGGSTVAGSGIFLMYPNKSLYGSKAIVRMETYNGDLTRVYLFKKEGGTLTCLAKEKGASVVEFDLSLYEKDTFFIVGVGGGAFKYKFQENAGGYKLYQLSSASMDISGTASMPSPSLNMTNNVSIECVVDWTMKGLYDDVETLKRAVSIVAEKQVLKVAKDGTGDFTTINEAMSYAQGYMTNAKRVSIVVYPGIYDEVVNVLGNKFVSIIGVNRNDCIIRDTSGVYNNCPLRIEGNSYVANLTLISTHSANAEYIVDGELKVNPSYALHIDDRHADNDDDYRCTIFNCRMYSENNPAVGIGLDKNQVVELIQCELETKISDEQKDIPASSGLWAWKPNGGALFYHALYPNKYPISGDSGYQKLVVKDCVIKSNINNTISGEGGGMDASLELTLIGNACYSTKNGKAWAKIPANIMNPLCSGNNIDSMNE